jgi:hypothetical protein
MQRRVLTGPLNLVSLFTFKCAAPLQEVNLYYAPTLQYLFCETPNLRPALMLHNLLVDEDAEIFEACCDELTRRLASKKHASSIDLEDIEQIIWDIKSSKASSTDGTPAKRPRAA